jgi:predicted nucleotidyltransferase
MDTKTYANNFEKLKTGTLLRSIQKENGEPENIALDQVSKELRFIQRQSQYVGEIDRVLKEMRLTVSLIKGCRNSEVSEGVSRQELLAYYQGNFFTLVHQMKDKILQLVYLITEETIPENPSSENDVSISDILKKKLEVIKIIGIEDEIRQWEQENKTSKMAVVLRKRTAHHHRVSGLKYDKDFLNLGFTDIAKHPSFQETLSDYGKEHIEKIRAESMERLFSGALLKVEDTLKAVEENVDSISNALVIYFKLPISQDEIKKIIDEMTAIQKSFEIINKSSSDKIPEFYKKMLDALIIKIKEENKYEVSSVYLVGSLGRGEYEEGYSDMNIYAVLNIETELGQVLNEDEWFSLRVFTKAEFLSEKCKKFRIIAKADGVLLYGEDLVSAEKFPKTGLYLALTLYDDILEILYEAKKWIEENPTASALEISKKSRRLAKRIIDFIYGVVMSNKPQYTASRKDRTRSILEMYPENDNKVIETLVGISRYGVGEPESFKNIIEGFAPKAEMNLKKMVDVKDELEKKRI